MENSAAQNEQRLREYFDECIRRTQGSFVPQLEIEIPSEIDDYPAKLRGRLAGNPLVREWEYHGRFRYQRKIPVSDALGLNSYSGSARTPLFVRDWTAALREFGRPVATFPEKWKSEMIVVWHHSEGELEAALSTKTLIEAGTPFTVTRVRFERTSPSTIAGIYGDVHFEGIGTFEGVMLGTSEWRHGAEIYPASLTDVGKATDDPIVHEHLIQGLKATRRPPTEYAVDRGREIVQDASVNQLLRRHSEEIEWVANATSLRIDTKTGKHQVEGTASYGGESWGTGRHYDESWTKTYLVCDNREIDITHLKNPGHGHTGRGRARALLEKDLDQMEQDLASLERKLGNVRLSYHREGLDPEIYADLRTLDVAPGTGTLTDPETRAHLEVLQSMITKARATVFRFQERANPERATEVVRMSLPDILHRLVRAERAIPEEHLEGYASGLQSEAYAARKKIDRANEHLAQNDPLAAEQSLTEAEPLLTALETRIADARQTRAAYLERKTALVNKAAQLKQVAEEITRLPTFHRIPSRSLREEVGNVRQEGFVKNRYTNWNADNYERWCAAAQDTLERAQAALTALSLAETRTPELSSQESSIPAQQDPDTQPPTEWRELSPQELLERILEGKDRTYARILTVQQGRVTEAAPLLRPEEREIDPRTVPIGKSGRSLSIAGREVRLTYGSGNAEPPYLLEDGLYVVSRDAREVLEVERTDDPSPLGLKALRFVKEVDDTARIASSSTTSLPPFDQARPSLGASLGAKLLGLGRTPQKAPAPQPRAVEQLSQPAAETKREEMTLSLREAFRTDLRTAGQILEVLGKDLSRTVTSGKPDDRAKKLAMLQTATSQCARDRKAVEQELENSESVDRVRGITGEIIRRTEKLARDVTFQLHEPQEWPQRYKVLFGMVPAIAADWGGELSEDVLSRLVPGLVRLAKGSTDFTPEAIHEQLSEMVGEALMG